jgi:archaeal type IV pilus assembly protein PilA
LEGKKYRALGENCQAVSEVLGQVLMIAIVVLAFSSIAITIFSDAIVINPPHKQHTAISERIDTNADIIQILHSGGEAINLKAIKIILSVNGKLAKFNVSDPSVKILNSRGSASNNGFLMLGDCIEINMKQLGIYLKDNDTVDMYLVNTKSGHVIQRAELHGGE